MDDQNGVKSRNHVRVDAVLRLRQSPKKGRLNAATDERHSQ